MSAATQPVDRAMDQIAIFILLAWLIVPTLSLAGRARRLPRAVGYSPCYGAVILAAGALLLLLPALAPLGALLVCFTALPSACGYVRHRQMLYPRVFIEDHLRSVMTPRSGFISKGAQRREPEKLHQSQPLAGSRASASGIRPGRKKSAAIFCSACARARREWRYGDRVRFWMRPSLPRDSGNPGGFNYATYLANGEIYVTGFLENDNEVELVSRANRALRGIAIETLRRRNPPFHRAQSFRQTTALWSKRWSVGEMGGITKEMRAAFTAAGVNHVLSISGLHVAMLGLVVFAADPLRLGRSAAIYCCACNLLKVGDFLFFFRRGVLHGAGGRAWCRRCARRS